MAASDAVGDGWTDVAARGTDPELLARVVARLAGHGGDARTLARAAAARELTHPAPPGPQRLLAEVAGPPSAAAREAAGQVARRWRALGVTAAVVGDPAYPARLAAGWPATAGPPVLAWRGPAVPPGGAAVAIVGARRATSYGTGVAAWLAESAAAAGITVVSGGAVGIDAAAHAATLGHPGRTVAVLGCGHEVGYPRVHARPGGLFARILEAGGWLASELLPDVPPRPATVLARNRIVAGLADAVVVVEGGTRSGSLRTAAMAADRGVPVLAVPGDVRAPGSAAPHRLLAEGAAPCAGPADLVAAVTGELGAGVPPTGDLAAGQPAVGGDGDGTAVPSALPARVRTILAQRWPRAVRVDDLARSARIEAGGLLAALTRARIAGEVAEGADGVRLTRPPRSDH